MILPIAHTKPASSRAIADPNHPEHAERMEWIGGHFDPANVNADALGQAVHSLAKKWTRRPLPRQSR